VTVTEAETQAMRHAPGTPALPDIATTLGRTAPSSFVNPGLDALAKRVGRLLSHPASSEEN
jgi:hypothetical protein